MQIIVKPLTIILFLIFSFYGLHGQTELETLTRYKDINSWQTPKTEIDSLLNSVFEGGNTNFTKLIYKNLRLESRHKDHWVKNYLVEIKASSKEIVITFRNRPLDIDKKHITETIQNTKKFWKNQNPILINILISSDIENKFNKFISIAYFQINYYRMVSLSNCNIEDECIFENKEELKIRVEDLLRINEREVAIYYLKVLARRFPFDKAINRKLWNLIKRN